MVDNIAETIAGMTKPEAIAHLKSRISALEEDVEIFGETAEDRRRLIALKLAKVEVENREN